ncbi:tetratricopeptide repeat protein [Intestinibacter bartlettii]|uniref:Tetratricopeptide repeat protein n=1 Tax=Intestinibacter bartlettii TaxID=261299 RepID=A0ABS6DX18_9FIRM|nr:tetratricopeptide repeat protein [Intestinibacter bartlettii]MBU5336401.1 tetratricopeptide repeat protein [Intestinibacter bartlettii]
MLFDKIFRDKEYLDHKTLGDLAMEIGEYDRAIKHYKKQLDIISETNYDDEVFDVDSIEGTYLEYELYDEISKAYQYKNDYKNTIKYVKLMIEDDENRGVNKGESVIKLAQFYTLNNQKSEAIKILDELLNYEKDQIEKNYNSNSLEKNFDNTYEKQQYLKTCYELIKLLNDTDKQKSIFYMNLAIDMYNKHGKNDLGLEIASILRSQSNFYKEEIDSSLKSVESQQDKIGGQEIEKVKYICKNSLLESEIYMEEYEYEKSKSAILEGIDIYKKYKLDDYKLDFYLKYQLAKIDSELNDDFDNYPAIFEEYLQAYKILEQHDFFDEYNKNMILLELYSYNNDYDAALKYKKQCDYYYIAEYNIKRSKKKKVSFLKEYFDAGNSYFSCQNYNMALKCYKKSMQNLILNMGIFEGNVTDFKDENAYYDSVERSYFGYVFYIKLCDAIANVYKEIGNLDKQLEYLEDAVKCLDEYYYERDFNSSRYTLYTNIFSDIVEIYIKKEDYNTAINYELLLIGIYNSPNLEKSINKRFEDIDKVRGLFEKGEIKKFILSDSYKFNLENKWLNNVKSCFEKIVQIAKLIEDDELIKISEKKIKILKDIPFDLDI